ncbi:MAG TPA: glycosyl hydrolase, partial [Gemmatimonadaceae bacterium]|nr:glycosyl hydrolase [Gemmatimonadaceae bacterium]
VLSGPDEILLGAYDSGIPVRLDGVLALEKALGVTLPLVHLYTAWGDQPDQQFPRRVVQAISYLGSIPVVTWEPWLSTFEQRLHPNLPAPTARDKGGLAAVARGDYDFYIDRWAADAAVFGRPVMVRFAHEMNDAYRYPWGPHHNSVQDYIAAWRHVVERFRNNGADNVVWIWSPHVGFDGWDVYYPGNDVVDWVASGALNYATVAYWSKWWTFGEIFGSKYARLASYEKPIMIAELGTLAVGGDPIRWYREALTDMPQKYPRVKAVIFFHTASDRTVTQQTLDWSFANDRPLLDAIASAIRPWAPPAH